MNSTETSGRRPLRILQVSDAFRPFPGGVSEHLYHLTRALQDLGHDARVLTTRYPMLPDPEDPPWVHRLGRVVTLPLNQSQITFTFHPLLPLKVRAFLRQHTFDVVHVHGPLAPNLPALVSLLSPYPLVATFHTAFTGYNWYRPARFFFQPIWKRIRVAITVSTVARDVMAPYFHGSYVIIPNGVDLQRFHPNVPPVSTVIRSGSPRILFLGRLEERKGPHLLLQALPDVFRALPDAVAWFAGEGPLRSRLKARVASDPLLRDRVYFWGHARTEEVPSLYRSADVYVSPATGGETFGIVLLEAMACGTPVVAGNNPGYRQVIRDGVNGLLVNPENSSDLSHAILRVLKDPETRERLHREGLDTARAHGWNQIATRVLAVYRQVLDGQR